MESGHGEAPHQKSSGGGLEVLVTAGPTTASNEAPSGEDSRPVSPRWGPDGEKLSFLKRASRKLRQRCAAAEGGFAVDLLPSCLRRMLSAPSTPPYLAGHITSHGVHA